MTCAACHQERPVMLWMSAGRTGAEWCLCSVCWRDGARPPASAEAQPGNVRVVAHGRRR